MYFSTIDLAKGYYQIKVNPRDIHKTAFTAGRGKYEFLRMPMGMKNSSFTFQSMMTEVLSYLIGIICVVYLDDMTIFSVSLEEHLQALDKVLLRLKQHGLIIQPDKCEFMKRDCHYLGHVVTADGIKPNPNKIEAIVKYPIPKTPKQIKSFLGVVGFYRKFIRNFAHIAKPLTNSLKNGVEVDFHNPKYIKSFEFLTDVICTDPILAYPDYNKKFVLTTDASNVALGAGLSQDN